MVLWFARVIFGWQTIRSKQKDFLSVSVKGSQYRKCLFVDIAAFHLQNPSRTEILAVNFECNKGFFPEGVQDCECMFRPKNVGKG